MRTKDPNKYPRGLNAAKVRRIIEHYDRETADEAAEEIRTAPRVEPTAWVEVPEALLPRVRKLLAGHKRPA